MKIAFITSSCINSRARYRFAREALESLRRAVGEDNLHVVADDLPRCRFKPLSFLVNPLLRGKAPQLYRGRNTVLLRDRGRSSNAAFLKALRAARGRGCELAFIHLDDNVYLPELEILLEHAQAAFAAVPELVQVRLSGYPIIHEGCTRAEGNRTSLQIDAEEIAFDEVVLRPRRFDDFTLWHAALHANMAGGRFWPFVLWNSLYRADYLEALLTAEGVGGLRTLAQVEYFYKEPENWARAVAAHPGSLGYINMQFGAFEMHQNPGWRDTLLLPNTPLR